jgi:hypothetical protein
LQRPVVAPIASRDHDRRRSAPASARPAARRARRVPQYAEGRGGRGAIDEADFRRHFAAHYRAAERYEDYARAYAIGAALARDSACRGRSWEELREVLRSDWEAAGMVPDWARGPARGGAA